MVRHIINFINPYDAGKFPVDISRKYGIKESSVIQLASNENPFPPSPEVSEAYEAAIHNINRYPHSGYPKLKEAISSYLNIDEELIAVGNGASDILEDICNITLDVMDKVTIPVPTYTLYAIFAMMRDASINFINFPNYQINGEKIPDSKLIFLCSPNNPTGNIISRKEILSILKNTNGYVILDEAYSEFSDETCIDLIKKFDNLIVVRSFSKFFGLAGMRVGYAVGNVNIVSALEKTRPPFSISSVSQSLAISAINSVDYYLEIKEKIIKERERVTKEIEKMNIGRIYPSKANFFLINTKDIFNTEFFEKQGIIIRNLTGLMGLEDNHIRITVGKEEENNRLLEVLRGISKK